MWNPNEMQNANNWNHTSRILVWLEEAGQDTDQLWCIHHSAPSTFKNESYLKALKHAVGIADSSSGCLAQLRESGLRREQQQLRGWSQHRALAHRPTPQPAAPTMPGTSTTLAYHTCCLHVSFHNYEQTTQAQHSRTSIKPATSREFLHS